MGVSIEGWLESLGWVGQSYSCRGGWGDREKGVGSLPKTVEKGIAYGKGNGDLKVSGQKKE